MVLGSIDWAATGAMLAGIGTLVGAGAVIYAAHKGSDTYKQWRRQKNEERRIELAEQLLTLSYKVRRAIQSVRSPMMFDSEVAETHEALRKNGQIKDDTPLGHISILQTAQATLLRLDASKPLWDDLLEAMPAAKAVFGDDLENTLDEFWDQRKRIILAARRYARLTQMRPARTEEAIERQLKRQFETEAIIWNGGGEDGIDTVADAVNGAIQNLEAVLLPIIRGDTPFGFKKMHDAG